MTDISNDAKQLDDPNANMALDSHKWLLMKKEEKQKIIHNRLNIILALGFLVIPFLLLINVIIHRLWGYLIAIVVFIIIGTLISAGSNGFQGPIVMLIFQIGCWLFYCLSRSEAIRIRLSSDGWHIQAVSNKSSKSAAIKEWREQKIIVK